MSSRRAFSLHRRHCLRTLGGAAALLGLPPLPFGRAASAAQASRKYSKQVVDLVERSLVMGLQNADEFREPKDVKEFYQLGLRCAQLTYNTSPRPIAITHSNCRALNNHPRLKTDEAIRKLAAKGGVMGITGVRNFVKDREPTTVEDVVDHIDHVARLVGVEHVGIGTDSDLMGYDHMPPDQYEKLKASYKSTYAFRDKIDTDGFNHPRKIYDLTDALVRRGYSDNNIQAVLGGNFRHLLGESWRQPPQTEKKS